MSATTADIYADLDRLRFTYAAYTPAGVVRLVGVKASPKPKAKKISGEFLKGPIPLPWLTAVTGLSGKAPLAEVAVKLPRVARVRRMRVVLADPWNAEEGRVARVRLDQVLCDQFVCACSGVESLAHEFRYAVGQLLK